MSHSILDLRRSRTLEIIEWVSNREDRCVLKVREQRGQGSTQTRILALKVVRGTHKDLPGVTLLQEFQRLLRWRHPLLPQAERLYLQVQIPGLSGPWVGFTQEWIDGPSLVQRLKSSPEGLSGAEAETLAETQLGLLAWFSEGGWAGLDLSAEDVIFTPKGIRVLDLEQVTRENPLLARRGHGTAHFAAPEVLEGFPADARSDLYALGRVLLLALTGNLPFPKAESLPEAARVVRQSPALTSEQRTALSARSLRLARLLPQLLAPDPSERPATAEDALHLLEAPSATTWRRSLPLPPAWLLTASSTMAPGQEGLHAELDSAWHAVNESKAGQGFRLVGPSGAGSSGAGYSRFLQDTYLRSLEAGRWTHWLRGAAGDDPGISLLLAIQEQRTAERGTTFPPYPLEGTRHGISSEDRAQETFTRIATGLRQNATRPLLLLVEAPDLLEPDTQALLLRLIRLGADLPILLVVHPPQSESSPLEPSPLKPSPQRVSSSPHLIVGLSDALTLLKPLELSPLTLEQGRALAEAHLPKSPLDVHSFSRLWQQTGGLAGRWIEALTEAWRHPLAPGCMPETFQGPPLPQDTPIPAEVWLEKASLALHEGRIGLARHLAKQASATLNTPSVQAQALRIEAEAILQLGYPQNVLRLLEPSKGQTTEPALAEPALAEQEALMEVELLWIRARAYKATGAFRLALETLQQLLTRPAEQRLTLRVRIQLRELLVWLHLVAKEGALAREGMAQTWPLLMAYKLESREPGPELSLQLFELWAEMLLTCVPVGSGSGEAPGQERLVASVQERLATLATRAQNVGAGPQELRARMLLAELGDAHAHPNARLWLEAARDRARALFDLATEAATLGNLTRHLIRKGELEPAQVELIRAQGVAERLQDQTSRIRILLQRCDLYEQAQRPASAWEVLQKAHAALAEGATPQLRPWALQLEARYHHAEGQPALAQTRMQAAYEGYRTSGPAARALEAGVEWLEFVVADEALLDEEARKAALDFGQKLLEQRTQTTPAAFNARLHRALATLWSPEKETQGSAKQAEGELIQRDFNWLQRIGQLLDVAQSDEALAQALSLLLAELLEGRSVVLLEGPYGFVSAKTGMGLEQLKWVSKSVVAEVKRRHSPWTCADLYVSPERAGQSVREQGQRSVACFPILAASRCIGVLYVDHKEVARVTSSQALALIQWVASFTGNLLKGRDQALADAVDADIPSFGLVGTSPAMQRLRKDIARMCRPENAQESCCFLGPSGVGKSSLAELLHRHGARPHGPFHCTTLLRSQTMIESELFGIAKNSGLSECPGGKAGILENSEGGTCMLDEIQCSPLEVQRKLLTFLQDRYIQRVGGTGRGTKLEALRLLFACSVDPRELGPGEMDPAFCYRIWRNPIRVPSLQARGAEDIRLLLEHFLRQDPVLATRPAGLYEQAYDRKARSFLERYTWPGNVRELQQVAGNRALAERIQAGDMLRMADLEDSLMTPPSKLNRALTPDHWVASLPPPGLTRVELWQDYIGPLTQRYYQRELDLHDKNVRETSRALGITRPTFYNLLKKGDHVRDIKGEA